MEERRIVRLPTGARLAGPHGEDLSAMSWQTIIDIFSEDMKRAEERVKVATVRMKKGRKESRLPKMLGLARLTLMSLIKRMHEKGGSDARFFVDLVRLLEQTEDLMGAYEQELEVWGQFRSVVVEKLKKERLLVYDKKTPDKLPFEKAKEMFQDPHGLV